MLATSIIKPLSGRNRVFAPFPSTKKRGKGSLDEITLWTPRLKKALKLLDDHNNGEKFEYVFGAPNIAAKRGIQMSPGKKMHKNTLDSQWQKLINRAIDEGLINEKWHRPESQRRV
ncbi:hypothetical protein J7438_23900 [Thalassotalea sp. G20_0]|uniref:hypothetical protein n=1 Tax=Thalassotalea sp. G20_0 TaxID=2821093 RepID=UPI001ADB973C|nr:hypothetical protein [Thalassotalea sp. G20_0]MBO9497107.1 hypothetical protein [Thalassotalea sp. G20_0]